jgi:hypothetical protein
MGYNICIGLVLPEEDGLALKARLDALDNGSPFETFRRVRLEDKVYCVFYTDWIKDRVYEEARIEVEAAVIKQDKSGLSDFYFVEIGEDFGEVGEEGDGNLGRASGLVLSWSVTLDAGCIEGELLEEEEESHD